MPASIKKAQSVARAELEDLVADLRDILSSSDTLSASPEIKACLLYTSPSPRDVEESRMPSSA